MNLIQNIKTDYSPDKSISQYYNVLTPSIHYKVSTSLSKDNLALQRVDITFCHNKLYEEYREAYTAVYLDIHIDDYKKLIKNSCDRAMDYFQMVGEIRGIEREVV